MITIVDFVKKNMKKFCGVSVETQDKLEKIVGEGKCGHWKASAKRLKLQTQILILSRHEPGKVVVANVVSVTSSKSFPDRCIIGIDNAIIQNWKIGKNEKLLFSRNPVHYYQ